MVYQDHRTKLCFTTSLILACIRCGISVAGFFFWLEAPCILQSDKGSEFTAEVVNDLKQIGPDLVIVYGKPMHP